MTLNSWSNEGFVFSFCLSFREEVALSHAQRSSQEKGGTESCSWHLAGSGVEVPAPSQKYRRLCCFRYKSRTGRIYMLHFPNLKLVWFPKAGLGHEAASALWAALFAFTRFFKKIIFFPLSPLSDNVLCHHMLGFFLYLLHLVTGCQLNFSLVVSNKITHEMSLVPSSNLTDDCVCQQDPLKQVRCCQAVHSGSNSAFSIFIHLVK